MYANVYQYLYLYLACHILVCGEEIQPVTLRVTSGMQSMHAAAILILLSLQRSLRRPACTPAQLCPVMQV